MVYRVSIWRKKFEKEQDVKDYLGMLNFFTNEGEKYLGFPEDFLQ